MKLLRIAVTLVVGLVASLMLVKDPFLQIFAVWLVTHLILKANFPFQPHPLKVLMLAFVTVLSINLTRSALNLGLADGDLTSKMERFIVDWGISGSPMKCGGNMKDGIVPPTHTATCDIWSDPETIIDQRVERILESTRYESKAMEDFLETSLPDGRSRAKDDEAEGMIV